jgi:hypothetical protein
LSASPIQLDVRPAASPAHWWLPARKVAMKDAWSVEPAGLSAGDEVVRTITVEAEGVRPEQIPDIVAMAETRGFQITPVGVRRSGSTNEAGSKRHRNLRVQTARREPGRHLCRHGAIAVVGHRERCWRKKCHHSGAADRDRHARPREAD